MTPNLADLRKDYSHARLDEGDVAAQPFGQFENWLNAAQQAQCPEHSAMSLATVGANGRPSSRIVLLKKIDAQIDAQLETTPPRGLVWFTHYSSKKGQELAANPHAALLFHWVELEREVRIEGRVEKTSAAESDAYFHSRPLKSRYGALASAQSQVIAHRETLEAEFAAIEKQYGAHPPRPQNWGGYRLVPDYFEFWQGRRSRLHDRLVYRLDAATGAWTLSRLAP